MDNKAFEQKLRDFLASELQGMHYQGMVTFTDGKHEPSGKGMMIHTTMVGNVTPNTPFGIFHAVMNAMHMQAKGLFVRIYGGELRQEPEQRLTDYG
jgi:hypothetical protein